MKTRFIALAALLSLGLGAGSLVMSADTQAKPAGNVYGKIFADWYDVFTNNNQINSSSGPEKSAFEITRAYFGYNYKIDPTFTADVLLDVERVDPDTKIVVASTQSSTGAITSLPVTPTVDKRYVAYLKTAFLAWKDVLPYTTLSMGQIWELRL